MRYLAATELLYVMYIGSVARNRMSKKLERLLSVMLLPIINMDLMNVKVVSVGVSIGDAFTNNQHGSDERQGSIRWGFDR